MSLLHLQNALLRSLRARLKTWLTWSVSLQPDGQSLYNRLKVLKTYEELLLYLFSQYTDTLETIVLSSDSFSVFQWFEGMLNSMPCPFSLYSRNNYTSLNRRASEWVCERVCVSCAHPSSPRFAPAALRAHLVVNWAKSALTSHITMVTSNPCNSPPKIPAGSSHK